MTTPIPGPQPLPVVGNLYNLDTEHPVQSLMQLADQYGEIYSLTLGGNKRLFVSSFEIMDELCDEKKFCKEVNAGLYQVRNGIGSGLFTAWTHEEKWAIAHRVLMPAFGPLSIRGMYDEMYDIASQLVMKWARLGPTNKILVSDDFTRLTLDSIALCAMGQRFNSFYHENMHPFVTAMVSFLLESGHRSQRPAFMNTLMRARDQAYWDDVKLMQDICADIIKERRENPSDKKDLLNVMINGRDPKTGKGLTDEMISTNMIVFMIAGHETTSGLLSFAFYNLLKHPAAYQAAQEEVDRVIGKSKITVEHMSQLPYISAVLRETLRLTPTAAVISLKPNPDTTKEDFVTIGKGKYQIPKDQPMQCLLGKIQRDPAVYGDDAEEFKPERMLDESFEKLPKNAWKPFGNGVRACIGRPFAWQEAILAVAMLLQNFNFQFDDPSYTLAIKETLTLKPDNFYMRATLRPGIDVLYLEQKLQVSGDAPPQQDISEAAKKRAAAAKTTTAPGKPMRIFYGGNTGTCEALASRLASDARRHGYDATVESLDSLTENVPKNSDEPVVFISATYEGQPPDNAAHFIEWLRAIEAKEGNSKLAEGLKYAVFGCGHKDWQATFQKIPTEIDDRVAKLGATRLCERGVADAAAGDMFSTFDTWGEKSFWPAIHDAFGGAAEDSQAPSFDVEVDVTTRGLKLGQQLRSGLVLEAKTLTQAGEPEKRHLEVQLPSDTSYKCGDYLAVLPSNPQSVVKRAIRRFKLPWDANVTIRTDQPTTLPTDVPISVGDILSSYVELSVPATKRDVSMLAAAASDENIKSELERLIADTELFASEIASKRVSALSLLEKYPTLDFPFGDFLAMLTPMRVRQYSISSSPLSNRETCTVTYGVLDVPSLSTTNDVEARHLGVASNYLSTLEPGDNIQLAVRPSHSAFHLPLDVAKTPLIMVCAGTGLAPFRGFVQERAAQIATGRKLAPALLFVGCRSPSSDTLYKDEFELWQKLGAVDVRYAYSRDKESSEGCKYVQDRLWHDREEVEKLFSEGGKVYVCGSRDVGTAVKECCKRMAVEVAGRKGKESTEEEAENWFRSLGSERFATDVFA